MSGGASPSPLVSTGAERPDARIRSAETRAPTIALFGLFGVDNLGNEATLAATIHGLRARRPNARLILISARPDPRAGLEGFEADIDPEPLSILRFARAVRPARFREAARALLQNLTEWLRVRRANTYCRHFDALLVPGTGIADDFGGQGPYDSPLQLARWCAAARRRGVPVRFASIGAGPVAHPLSRRWFRDALRLADFRSYREVSSKAFALEIGIDAHRDPVLPDIVFSLPVPPELREGRPQWPPRTIGLGVMRYTGWNVDETTGRAIYAAYMAKMAALAEGLLDRGYAIRLLIGNRTKDVKSTRELSETLGRRGHPAAGRVSAGKIDTYVDLLGEIGRTDLVIATRFHNVLLAMLLGRPVISVGYARKNDELMSEMGAAELCHSAETFEPEAVLRQVDRMAAMPEPPIRAANARIEEHRRALQEQFDRLLSGL